MARTHTFTKIGTIVLVATVSAWFLISRWTSGARLSPLFVPLETREGARLSQSFEISADHYWVDVVCRAVGPLESKDNVDIEQKYKRVPCDLFVTFSREGNIILKRRVGFLDRGVWWNGGVRYYLLDLEMNRSGRYELTIDNGKDLSFLDPTEPRVEVRLNSSALETRLTIRALLPYSCAAIGIVALIMIGLGFLLPKATKRVCG